MKRLARLIAFLVISLQTGLLCAQAEKPSGRSVLINEIVNRSRLLEDAHFRVPRSVWRRFVIDEAKGPAAAPVSHIVSRGDYRLKTDTKGAASIDVEIHLLVFDARRSGPIAVLSDSLIWSKITLGDDPFKPATKGKWLVFQPAKPGAYVIRARAPVDPFKATGGIFALPIARSVRTSVALDSPSPFEVTASGAGRTAVGTRLSLAIRPTSELAIAYRPVQSRTDRQATYQIGGSVAWNFGPAAQQVSADLHIAILGGKTQSLELTVPRGAKRVSVRGPDVRDVRVSGPAARVFFRGAITSRTNLRVDYELPAAKGAADLVGPEIAGGRWSGGSLVITNTAGGSEIQPAEVSGLKEIALGDIPSRASAILAGKAVLAYSITSGQWSIRAESINLGEFAIKQTLADSARYQVAYRPDGTVICRADYEIRNRNRQFLRINLPPGAKVLLARVSEKSRPMTPMPGKKGEYLLPLERSTASVMGLVSFPVQLVYMYRDDPLKARGSGAVALPRIDIPIAYAWCQAHMPDGMSRVKFSGVMRPVEQYSSQTAQASMTYGSATALDPKRKRLGLPQAIVKKPATKTGGGLFGWLGGSNETNKTKDRFLDPSKVVKPATSSSYPIMGAVPAPTSLSRNYWRAGKQSYDQGKYDEADKALSRVVELAPNSPDAPNARRLLANIKLLKGKLQVKSRSEKVAAVKVKQRITAANTFELDQQATLLAEGKKAAEKGDTKRAQQKFQAAEALSLQLVAKGENVIDQTSRLRGARKQLDAVRKASGEKLDKGLKQLKQLRQAGRIAEAGVLARELAENSDALGNTGNAQVTKELQKEREQLAFDSARQTLQKDAQPAFRPNSGAGDGVLDRLAQIRTAIVRTNDGSFEYTRPDSNVEGREGANAEDREDDSGNQVRVRRPRGSAQAGSGLFDPPTGQVNTNHNAVEQHEIEEIYQIGDLVAADQDDDGEKNSLKDIDEKEASRNAQTEKLTRQVQSLVGDGKVEITLFGGQRSLKVTSLLGGQRATANLIEGLRQARGPQVQVGANLALQEGFKKSDGRFSYGLHNRPDMSNQKHLVIVNADPKTITTGGTTVISGRPSPAAKVDPNLQKFIDRNYAWRGEASKDSNIYSLGMRANAWDYSNGQGVQRPGPAAIAKKKAAEHLANGTRLLDSGNSAGAVGQLQAAVSLAPGLVEAHKLLALARKLNASSAGGGVGVLQRLTDRRSVRRGEAVMKYERAMQQSKELMAKADSDADFAAAIAAAKTAGAAVESAKSLLDAGSHGQMMGNVAGHVEWIGVNRDKWSKSKARMELQQIKRAKSQLIRSGRGKSKDVRRSEIVAEYDQVMLRALQMSDSRDLAGLHETYVSAMRAFRELNDNSGLFSPNRLEAMTKRLDPCVRSLGRKIKELQAERYELQTAMMTLLMSRKQSTAQTSPFESGLEDAGWASNLPALDVRRSDIPWHVMVTYPKDWKEITTRRKPRVEGWQTEVSRVARKQLDTTVSKLDFEDMELSQAMEFMRDVTGANIHVRWRALALESIEPASSVNVHLSRKSFRKSLEAILKDAGQGALDYIVDEGVIVVSTRKDFDRLLSLAVYDIRDIIAADRNPAFGLDWRISPADRARAVAEVMSGITRIVGRAGAVAETRGLLAAAQSRSNHKKILDLLNGIRKEKGLKPAGAPSLEDRRFRVPSDAIVGKLLDQKLSKLEFEDMELSQVFEFLRDVSGANIHVRWRAMALESIEPATTVNVHLSSVTFRKGLQTILDDVATGGDEGVGDTGLGYIVDQGVITVSTKADLAARIYRRSYDIGDLAADLDELASVIRKIVDPKSWAEGGGDIGTIEQQDARLAITQNAGNHAKIVILLNKLRWARALKGPVKWTQADRTAAKSRTKADRIVDKQLDTKVSKLDFEDMEFSQVMEFMRDVSGASVRVAWKTLAVEGIEPETSVNVHLRDVTFRKALEIVLDDVGIGGEPGVVAHGLGYRLEGGVIFVSTRVALGEVPEAAKRKSTKPKRETVRRKLSPAELVRKLRFNRGQKTQVASVNLNVDSATAGSLGVKFRKGNNDVSYTIVDEAQFRTLMEIDQAGASTAHNRIDLNETRQDTIVGTDALLANEMTTYVNRSGDKGNTLDINDNPISLSHEKYVLIDNAGYLTAVKAGQMQHWSQASKDIEFFKAPQTIEIPQIGETVRLEKTLVKPGDEMIVRFDY